MHIGKKYTLKRSDAKLQDNYLALRKSFPCAIAVCMKNYVI